MIVKKELAVRLVYRPISQRSKYSIQNKGYSQQRSFCPNCGTTLYWRVSAFPSVIGISAGCFIQQPLAKPHCTVEKQNQLDWFNLKGDWQESFDIKILTKIL